MSSVVISGNTSGSVTLDAPAVAGSTVITLPTTTGTAALTSDLFGQGQSWQSVSRSVNTSYQNTTGKTIMITWYGGSGSIAQASTNNSTWVNLNTSSFTSGTFVVPPDHYYRFNGGSISFIAELR